MKIHFCDLCNESVPQADLDAGRAFLRKDRVVCATCDRAMSHHDASGLSTTPPIEAVAMSDRSAPPTHMDTDFEGLTPERSYVDPSALGSSAYANDPPPVFASMPPMPLAHAPHAAHVARERSHSSSGLWVAVLGLLFTASAIFVLDDRFQAIEKQANDTSKLLEARTLEVASLQRRASSADDQLHDIERRTSQRFEGERTRREEVAADMGRVQQENTDLKAKIATLTNSIVALQQQSGVGNFDMEKRIADISARLAHSEDESRMLGEKLGTLEAATPVVAAAAPAAEAKSTETGWHLQLPSLKSDTASTRWEAVTALGATKDLETVPYLAPMLKDQDIFVRMAAARVLGDMQAKAGVPALIDALEDGETAVREAANIALRTITGKDFKFDPLAIEAERARRVKAWRDWWKKESDTPSGM